MRPRPSYYIKPHFWLHPNIGFICRVFFSPLLKLEFKSLDKVGKNKEIMWKRDKDFFLIILDCAFLNPSEMQEISFYTNHFSFFVNRESVETFNISTKIFKGMDFMERIIDLLFLSGSSPEHLYPESSNHELLERFLVLEKTKKEIETKYL